MEPSVFAHRSRLRVRVPALHRLDVSIVLLAAAFMEALSGAAEDSRRVHRPGADGTLGDRWTTEPAREPQTVLRRSLPGLLPFPRPDAAEAAWL